MHDTRLLQGFLRSHTFIIISAIFYTKNFSYLKVFKHIEKKGLGIKWIKHNVNLIDYKYRMTFIFLNIAF